MAIISREDYEWLSSKPAVTILEIHLCPRKKRVPQLGLLTVLSLVEGWEGSQMSPEYPLLPTNVLCNSAFIADGVGKNSST